MLRRTVKQSTKKLLTRLLSDEFIKLILNYRVFLVFYTVVKRKTIARCLNLIGFKSIIFDRYAVVNINTHLPTLITNGCYGITLLTKNLYYNFKFFHKKYRENKKFEHIFKISKMNNGIIPVSFLEANIVRSETYTIHKKRKRFNSINYDFIELVIGDTNKDVIAVPFIQGFFHFYLELMPFMLEQKGQYSFLISIPPEKFYFEVLDYFKLSYVSLEHHEKNLTSQFTIRKKFLYPDFDSLITLRRILLSKKFTMNSKFSRLYLTRRNNKNGRRLYNESEISDYLISKNFLIIDLDTIPFSQQINLMKSAEIVVAPHGAALSHLVCVSDHCKVIELNGDRDVRWHYYKISTDLKLDYSLLIGNTLNDLEFFLDLEKLKSALHSAGVFDR